MAREILLVEDDLILPQIESIFLGNDKIRLCRSIESAREALSSGNPDLVLLNLDLPDGSGLEVLKHIKEDDRSKEVPVVVITAEYSDETEEVCIMLGAEGFIKKPFQKQEL